WLRPVVHPQLRSGPRARRGRAALARDRHARRDRAAAERPRGRAGGSRSGATHGGEVQAMSDTDTKHLDWIAAPLLVAGQPRSWGAGVWPWTCVVTFNGATYAASANDSRVH